jgi:hypothetical protein
MRFFASLCGLLLIANIALFLWPQDARTAPQIHSQKQDVNPHFVRLNKEIEERYLDAKPMPIGSEEEGLLAESGEGGCYRLGPFMHKANYELAQAVLFNADVDYRKSTRASTESSMYRVYLGPYDSQAKATDVRTELKRSNVLDHFVRKEGDSQYIVSLGIYTTEGTALNAVGLLKSQLETIKLKQEVVVLPNSYWLHFDVEDQPQLKLQLARMDWGELSAKLGKYQCQLS